MKKIFFSLLVSFLLFTAQANACVGKILTIGVLNSANESVLAELVSALINERTGTTVNIKVYNSSKEIYEDVTKGEIGIVIENTERAVKMLNAPNNGDKAKAHDLVKEEFRNRMNLIWLKPFGTLSGDDGSGSYYYAPVMSEDVLIYFPALPKLINKLSDIANDRFFHEALNSVKSGEKAKKAAKDFLKKKKLI
ncbi:MAG: hypothetical protein HZC48_06160 [Nitrospirae bacterium]|nr:hypothetical protein [Nitrospirota bacterium]